MMWPLLAMSVATLAVVLERLVLFTTQRFPSADVLEALLFLLSSQGRDAALKQVEEEAPTYLAFFTACFTPQGGTGCEQTIQTAGEETLFRFNARLDFLATIATTAPLMGLLGTVLGMINAFSRLSASGDVDISMLAGGIWQALLTTAAGLCIAIPAILAHRWFCREYDKIAFAMQQAARLVLEWREALEPGR